MGDIVVRGRTNLREVLYIKCVHISLSTDYIETREGREGVEWLPARSWWLRPGHKRSELIITLRKDILSCSRLGDKGTSSNVVSASRG